MASSSHLVSSLVLLTFASSCLLFLQPHPSNANLLISCRFKKIYNFGDSISDTGNLIRQKPIGAASACARLPYGETFFKHATGRCSNGRLMIDFIANASGLPFLNPYLEKDADFRHGVDFAVAGATALPAKVLAKQNIVDPVTNSSLEVQLGWMSKHLNSTRIKQKTSLFLLGEIADNDYNYAMFEGKGIQEVKVLVPKVVAAIMSGVRSVISRHGAVRVIVPGLFPRGCSPVYLTIFQTSNSSAYDKHGCLKDINSIAYYHNEKLQEAILELKREYPDAIVVYGDYSRAFQWVFDHAVQFGFDGESTCKACCGIGGDYNFNASRQCSPEVPVCRNPNKLISWDGIHLTEAVYKRMAEWLMNDMLPKLKCGV